MVHERGFIQDRPAPADIYGSEGKLGGGQRMTGSTKKQGFAAACRVVAVLLRRDLCRNVAILAGTLFL